MKPIAPPSREFLPDRVATLLRREITAGRWRDHLPGERTLARVLNISRPTLRAALTQLVAAQELEVSPRNGYAIRRPGRVRRAARAVRGGELGIVCPERIYSMPPHVIQTVDILRGLSAEAGLHVETFEGRRFARTHPRLVMPRILRGRPDACWVAIMADRRLQEWLNASRTPAVLYGNRYPGVDLPCVGIDYRARVRHASAQLFARGHRRIVLVNFDSDRAGDQESMAGFHEGLRRRPGNPESRADKQKAEAADAMVISRPDDDVTALRRQIDRLMGMRPPPTAFIVSRTHHYATVATHLSALGWRIPEEVSLMSRGDDPFLHFLCPAPAHYRVNIELLARRLFQAVQRVMSGGRGQGGAVQLVPEYVQGETVGPGPARHSR